MSRLLQAAKWWPVCATVMGSAYAQEEGAVQVIDRPELPSALDVYTTANSSRLFVTVDAVAYAVARTIGRAVDQWETEQTRGLRDLSEALCAAPDEVAAAGWLRNTGRGAVALLEGWPSSSTDLDATARADLEEWWRIEDLAPSVAFRSGYFRSGERSDGHLDAAFWTRIWLSHRLQLYLCQESIDPKERLRRSGSLSRIVVARPELEPWLNSLRATKDALVGTGTEEELRRVHDSQCATVLAALGARIQPDNSVLEALDPAVIPMRTYCGGLDLLAAGPLASAIGREVWERFEQSKAARSIAGQYRSKELVDSVYDQCLHALALLTAEPAPWAREQAFVNTELWKLRVIQSQLSSWTSLRRSLARHTKVVVYGSRSDAVPDVIVDPYPRVFRGLASAVRAAGTALRPVLSDGSAIGDLEALVGDVEILAEVADGGFEAAQRHRNRLASIGETLSTYFGQAATMGDEEIVAGRSPQGTLVVGIGKPRRLIVEISIGGEKFRYHGAVMSYRERWEGTPAVPLAPNLDLSGRTYDWGLPRPIGR